MNSVKTVIKHVASLIALLIAFPGAALGGFGRFRAGYEFFAEAMALVPGLPGDYIRVAYYRLTLEKAPANWRISFGSTFAHREVRVEEGVYIGQYCILGRVEIGARSQIASGVQILSGSHQHQRAADGAIQPANQADFRRVKIGEDCWIGASAIVMADIGSGTTVGAGSVVTKPLPAGVTAVGSPARILQAPESQ